MADNMNFCIPYMSPVVPGVVHYSHPQSALHVGFGTASLKWEGGSGGELKIGAGQRHMAQFMSCHFTSPHGME